MGNHAQGLARRVALSLALCLAAVLVAGCATAPPAKRMPPEYAQAPHPDGPFAAIEAGVADRHGPERSGFNLLERSDRALKWRLALIDSARHSLDLQYYVWFGDNVGTLLMMRAIEAAERGVKVRILFDDLNSMLRDMAHVEIRDGLMARIDRHPNIQIRVFNAWSDRSLLGRGVDMLVDFARLNRRMHNKQMIVDNRVAIIGGRNLADEYFGVNPGFNFHDLDVLGVGPVARQASAVFDRFWNSEWVRPIPKPESGEALPTLEALRVKANAMLALDPSLAIFLPQLGDWSGPLEQLPSELMAGASAVHTDTPDRGPESRNHMPDAIRALMRSAQREVLITNAYIIPDADFMADLKALSGRGVQVRILTNSLSSHDVPAVNSHYERWRKPILETGAELHELRHDAEVRSEAVEIPPNRAEFVGLHTKAMVIDRKRAFIGSMNMDPRSRRLNSEMGVIIDSPGLAENLARRMARDMHGENSWRVLLTPDGELRWRSAAGELERQPARGTWQWIEDFLFKFAPADLY